MMATISEQTEPTSIPHNDIYEEDNMDIISLKEGRPEVPMFIVNLDNSQSIPQPSQIASDKLQNESETRDTCWSKCVNGCQICLQRLFQSCGVCFAKSWRYLFVLFMLTFITLFLYQRITIYLSRHRRIASQKAIVSNITTELNFASTQTSEQENEITLLSEFAIKNGTEIFNTELIFPQRKKRTNNQLFSRKNDKIKQIIGLLSKEEQISLKRCKKEALIIDEVKCNELFDKINEISRHVVKTNEQVGEIYKEIVKNKQEQSNTKSVFLKSDQELTEGPQLYELFEPNIEIPGQTEFIEKSDLNTMPGVIEENILNHSTEPNIQTSTDGLFETLVDFFRENENTDSTNNQTITIENTTQEDFEKPLKTLSSSVTTSETPLFRREFGEIDNTSPQTSNMDNLEQVDFDLISTETLIQTVPTLTEYSMNFASTTSLKNSESTVTPNLFKEAESTKTANTASDLLKETTTKILDHQTVQSSTEGGLVKFENAVSGSTEESTTNTQIKVITSTTPFENPIDFVPQTSSGDDENMLYTTTVGLIKKSSKIVDSSSDLPTEATIPQTSTEGSFENFVEFFEEALSKELKKINVLKQVESNGTTSSVPIPSSKEIETTTTRSDTSDTTTSSDLKFENVFSSPKETEFNETSTVHSSGSELQENRNAISVTTLQIEDSTSRVTIEPGKNSTVGYLDQSSTTQSIGFWDNIADLFKEADSIEKDTHNSSREITSDKAKHSIFEDEISTTPEVENTTLTIDHKAVESFLSSEVVPVYNGNLSNDVFNSNPVNNSIEQINNVLEFKPNLRNHLSTAEWDYNQSTQEVSSTTELYKESLTTSINSLELTSKYDNFLEPSTVNPDPNGKKILSEDSKEISKSSVTPTSLDLHVLNKLNQLGNNENVSDLTTENKFSNTESIQSTEFLKRVSTQKIQDHVPTPATKKAQTTATTEEKTVSDSLLELSQRREAGTAVDDTNICGNPVCFPMQPDSMIFPPQGKLATGTSSVNGISPRLVTGMQGSGYGYHPYPMYQYPGYGGGYQMPPTQLSPTPSICYCMNQMNQMGLIPPNPAFRQNVAQEPSVFRETIDSAENMVSGLQCSGSQKPCLDGLKCVEEFEWCDGAVQCKDASDEINCSCKSRVDKSRLCDGYFDCPNGDDELQCFNCPAFTFSCDDWTARKSGITCLPINNRCDGIRQCPNGKDEKDCSILVENLFDHQALEVSGSQGYLHHNFQGIWYPVCNINMQWPTEVCLSEVGVSEFAPEMRILSINGIHQGPYIQSVISGQPSMTGSCAGATYIVCPELHCGTRLLEDFAVENADGLEVKESDDLYRSKRSNDTNVRAKRQDEDVRVVGGSPSKPASWPWVVAMYRDGTFHCGGTILNKFWIISAAHCVDKFWHHYYEIQAGALRRFSYSPMEQIRMVSDIIVHQKYDRSNMKNDLALLRVKRPFSFNRWVRNICLPTRENAGPTWAWGPTPGTMCTTVGWGATFEHGPDPDHMREVEVPILSHCKHREDREGSELCAGLLEGGKDACQGDSGGPLLCRNPDRKNQWYLAGVVSHGEGCARPGEPGAYTRIPILRKWIEQNIQETSFPQDKPLLRCPGFQCSSATQRCLPRRRLCDGIVDCMGAEDELNCASLPNVARKVESTWKSLLSAKHSQQRLTIGDGPRAARNSPKVENTSQESLFSNPFSNLFDSVSKLSNDVNITTVSPLITTGVKSSLVPQDTMTTLSEFAVENVTSVSPISVSDVTTNEIPNISTTVVPGILTTLSQNDEEATTTQSPITTESQLVTQTENIELKSSTMSHIPIVPDLLSTPIPSTTTVSPDLTTESIFQTLMEISNGIPNFTIPILESKKEQLPTRIERKKSAYFMCSEIKQRISTDLKCNSYPDCEDGTDEKCSCLDVLEKKIPESICDGYVDCVDGSDEADCFSCPPGYFLCKLSHLCIDERLRCNGKLDCQFEEDEKNCYALTNGVQIEIDVDGNPKSYRDGIITAFVNSSWIPVCIGKGQPSTANELANDICNYLGHSEFHDMHNYTVNPKPLDIIYSNKTKIIMSFNQEINCQALYVYCHPRIIAKAPEFRYIHYQNSTELVGLKNYSENYNWPWNAVIYINGKPSCTGVLINLNWVLTTHYCINSIDPEIDHVVVLLGSIKLGMENPFEQIRVVNTINDNLGSLNVTLLHLESAANYSKYVKTLPLTKYPRKADIRDTCIATGLDLDPYNSLVVKSIFLKPVVLNCSGTTRCFKQIAVPDSCESEKQQWMGVISCFSSEVGWFPSALFQEPKGPCGFVHVRTHTDIGYLLHNIRAGIRRVIIPKKERVCNSNFRCPLGECLNITQVCDGNNDCHDGSDEGELACQQRPLGCDIPNQCECTANQLRCKNGRCVSKSKFCDQINDCGDHSDEPDTCSCVDYLKLAHPGLICDGVRNCLDKTDEVNCVCGPNNFTCSEGICIPKDFVCDGEPDCPHGEDEAHCTRLKPKANGPPLSGEVYVRTAGLWHLKCFSKDRLTKSEIEHLCESIGFESGRSVENFPILDEIDHQNKTIISVEVPVFDKFLALRLNPKHNLYVRINNSTKPLVTLVRKEISCNVVTLICT